MLCATAWHDQQANCTLKILRLCETNGGGGGGGSQISDQTSKQIGLACYSLTL